MDADKVVLTSAMVTLGSTVTASVAPTKWGGHGEFPHPRLLIGGGLTFFGLGILADFAPGLAGPLAAAVAFTALTYYGMPVLDSAFSDTPTLNKANPAQPADPANPDDESQFRPYGAVGRGADTT